MPPLPVAAAQKQANTPPPPSRKTQEKRGRLLLSRRLPRRKSSKTLTGSAFLAQGVPAGARSSRLKVNPARSAARSSTPPPRRLPRVSSLLSVRGSDVAKEREDKAQSRPGHP